MKYKNFSSEDLHIILTIVLHKSVDFSFMLFHYICLFTYFDEYKLVIAEQNKAGELTLSMAFDSA